MSYAMQMGQVMGIWALRALLAVMGIWALRALSTAPRPAAGLTVPGLTGLRLLYGVLFPPQKFVWCSKFEAI